ncbi:FMN-binding protein [Micromonospora inyonensis]|uniref:FMN-binding domain-containing protein n=1 Tax=Micromonospora inyonensis TaxID=47866 RepID=A0A1C6S0B1_9ACTN|nr:FMN-binding protein [Micromonospora inyonensis]SCL22903.1 FMN-binding domain-containing protein [Micromonospora inyonensis]
MRRAFLAVTGLAAGTTLLVVLKGAPETSRVAEVAAPERPSVVPAPAGPTRTGSAPASPGRTPAPRASTSAGPSDEPSTPAAGRSPRAPGSRTTSAAPTPRRTTAPPSTRRTVTGPVVGNEYGNVQVRITLAGDRIVDVVALELPEETAESDRRSSSVDDRYSGTDGEVVRRQDADLDTVSGATATSDAYQQSLQAAIDAVRR